MEDRKLLAQAYINGFYGKKYANADSTDIIHFKAKEVWGINSQEEIYISVGGPSPHLNLIYYKVQDYGITWALTKEELKNE